jgi:hypothetical protein
MPYPATISGVSWPEHRNNVLGPFLYEDSLYVAVLDVPNNHLEVWRSTDSGETWAEADAANHPAINNTASNRSTDAFVTGSVLSVGTVEAGSVLMRIWRFDLATNLWAGGFNALSGPQVYTNVTGKIAFGSIRRASGSYVAFYQGGPESIMGSAYRRVQRSISTTSGLTWATPQHIDVVTGGSSPPGTQVHYDMRAILHGSQDRAHLFYTETGATTLWHRCIISNNDFGTAGAIDTTVNVGNYPMGIPTTYEVDGVTWLAVPYVDSNGDLIVARAASADTIATASWSFSVVAATNRPETANSNPAALVAENQQLHCLWVDDTNQHLYRASDDGNGNFAAEVVYRTGITTQGVNQRATFSQGVLYNDGGTVKYDKSSPPTPKLQPGGRILAPIE